MDSFPSYLHAKALYVCLPSHTHATCPGGGVGWDVQSTTTKHCAQLHIAIAHIKKLHYGRANSVLH